MLITVKAQTLESGHSVMKWCGKECCKLQQAAWMKKPREENEVYMALTIVEEEKLTTLVPSTSVGSCQLLRISLTVRSFHLNPLNTQIRSSHLNPTFFTYLILSHVQTNETTMATHRHRLQESRSRCSYFTSLRQFLFWVCSCNTITSSDVIAVRQILGHDETQSNKINIQ